MIVRPLVRHLGALSLITLLAACTTVGPDYARPDDATINRSDAQAPFTSIAATPDRAGPGPLAVAPLPDHWWKLYNDATLDALIERAFARNT
ncbi:MAG: hypothetical protein EOO29_35990, partial [Comamonadaceae bacterium]